MKDRLTDSHKKRKISKKTSLNVYDDSIVLSKWLYIIFITIIVALVINNKINKPEIIRNDKIKQIIKSQGLDDISEYSLNMELAEEANLPVVFDTYYKTESAIYDFELSGAINDNVSVKAVPIFDLADVDRKITYHTVQTGETINQIAEKYNLTINTIKWANKLKTDNLNFGQKLKILPLDGIIYKVKNGDSLDKIAKKYKANKDRIVVFNDLEVSGIKINQDIIIPEGVLPLLERPDYVAPRIQSRNYYSYISGTGSGGRINMKVIYPSIQQTNGNRYFPRNCTWYAYERRKQLNRPIGGHWGNANSWARSARNAGFTVTRTPMPGSVFQTSGESYWGHVGIVEAVKPNGNLIITEMNYVRYTITSGEIKASAVKNYLYIY